MTDETGRMDASAFRVRHATEQAGTDLTLLSGAKVRVRRPQINALIQNGVIPGALVMSSVNVAKQQIGPNDLKNYIQLKRLYARLTLLEPAAVEGDPENDDQISLDWLSDDEIDELYNYATGGMDGLEQFRKERQELFTGSDREEVPRDQAKRPVRPEEPGQS